MESIMTVHIPVQIEAFYDYALTPSTRGNWKHRIVLDCTTEEPRVSVVSSYGTGTPEPVYNLRQIMIGIIPEGVSDTNLYKTFLESHGTQLLLQSIHAGYSLRNHQQGQLTDDAGETQELLIHMIQGIDAPSYWDVRDWIDTCEVTDLIKDANIDPEENLEPRLKHIRDNIVGDAKKQGISLSTWDTLEYLREVHQEMKEDN
ncbi:MAG: hypothetical protein PHD25_12315 [Bacteroidales bacterium]|nr:hypothetical protein [Bacteroidales bacterium]